MEHRITSFSSARSEKPQDYSLSPILIIVHVEQALRDVRSALSTSESSYFENLVKDTIRKTVKMKLYQSLVKYIDVQLWHVGTNYNRR